MSGGGHGELKITRRERGKKFERRGCSVKLINTNLVNGLKAVSSPPKMCQSERFCQFGTKLNHFDLYLEFQKISPGFSGQIIPNILIIAS